MRSCQIFLWIALKKTFAGRAAEVELATIIVEMMTSRRYFYRHVTNQVDCRLRNNWKSHFLTAIRLSGMVLTIGLNGRQPSALHLYQFGDDAASNLFRCYGSNVE